MKKQTEEQVKPLSERIRHHKELLLATLFEQLDKDLADVLARDASTQEGAALYAPSKKDDPLVDGIKKLMNVLHCAEQLEEIKERGQLSGAGRFKKLEEERKEQLAQALAQLEPIDPELVALLNLNYDLINPIASILSTEVSMLNNFTKILGLNPRLEAVAEQESARPIIDVFAHFRAFVMALAAGEGQAAQHANAFLDDLDKELLLQGLSLHSDALGMLKKLVLTSPELNDHSVLQYAEWVQRYLPKLMLDLDNFEQQHNMRSGLLTAQFRPIAEKLVQQINEYEPKDSSQKPAVVPSVIELKGQRLANIETRAQGIQARWEGIKKTQKALSDFYKLLERYKGRDLSAITENDRARLRQIYPKMQQLLAQVDSKLEKQMSAFLDPELKQVEPVSVTEFLKSRDKTSELLIKQERSEQRKQRLLEQAKKEISQDPSAALYPLREVEEPVAPLLLSTAIQHGRVRLLNFLVQQLDTDLGKALSAPSKDAPPYSSVKEDDPLVEGIKKVMNVLYYAEMLIQIKEKKDNTKYFATTRSIKPGIQAAEQLTKATAELETFGPELFELMKANYTLISPLIKSMSEEIPELQVVLQFLGLPPVEQVDKFLDQAVHLLGPGRDGQQNPLVSAFENLDQFIIALAQSKDNVEEQNKAIRYASAFLQELDNNPLFHQLSVHFEALEVLKQWILEVQRQGTQFTDQSVAAYAEWVRLHLPELLIDLDAFEQQNGLKSGLLTQRFSSIVDKLIEQVNEYKPQNPEWNIAPVPRVSELAEQRLVHIEKRALATQARWQRIKESQQAAEVFYKVLKQYKGRDLSSITEKDRVILRQMYPKIQEALAYADIQLEHRLTEVLNQKGPENEPKMPALGEGEVGAVLKTKEYSTDFLLRQEKSEQRKHNLLEKSKKQISQNSEARLAPLVQKKSNGPEKPIKAGEIQPFDGKKLITFRNALQQAKLLNFSQNIAQARQLILRRLPPEHVLAFEGEIKIGEEKDVKVLHEVGPNANRSVDGLKALDNALYELEKMLKKLESMDESMGFIESAKLLGKTISLFLKLKEAIEGLDPELKKQFVDLQEKLNETQSILIHREKALKETLVSKAKEEPDLKAMDAAIDALAQARGALIGKAQLQLAGPLREYFLNTQESGVPFIHFEGEPPQVVALKQMINALYLAQTALTLLKQMNQNPESELDKLVLMHQQIAALSQLYKIADLIQGSWAAQELVLDNYELLEPVFSCAEELLLDNAEFLDKSKALGGMKKVVSSFGQGLNRVRKEGGQSKHSLIFALMQLPELLNGISSIVIPNWSLSSHDLKKLDQSQIDALASVWALALRQRGFFSKATDVFGAVSALKAILANLHKMESSHLIQYKKWMEHYYPLLLEQLDAIEVSQNLEPGLLSKPIIAKIDQLNALINEKKPEIAMPLSQQYARRRALHLDSYREALSRHMLEVAQQEKACDAFFKLCYDYGGKKISELSLEERQTLEGLFAQLQMPLAHHDLELANRVLDVLQGTRDETLGSIAIHKPELKEHLEGQRKALQLKLEVTNEAIHVHGVEIKKDGKELQSTPKNTESTALQHIQASSLRTVRGVLASLQEKKFSQTTQGIKEQFQQAIRKNLAGFIQEMLLKEQGKPHVLHEEDPTLVQQIKTIENCLDALSAALREFESLKKTDSYLMHAAALFAVLAEIKKVEDGLNFLSPTYKAEIKESLALMHSFVQGIYSLDLDVSILPEAMQSEAGVVLKESKFLKIQIDDISSDRGAWLKAQSVFTLIKELDQLGNKAIARARDGKEFAALKQKAFEEILFAVSQKEDELGCKAGTFLGPALDAANEAFSIIGSSVEISYPDALKLCDQSQYIQGLLEQIQEELEQIKKTVMTPDLRMQETLKEQKIAFLQARLEALKQEENPKEKAFDLVVTARIANQIRDMGLKVNELQKEYSEKLREHLRVRVDLAGDPAQMGLLITQEIQRFNAEYAADYKIVDESCWMLEQLNRPLPKEHVAASCFAEKINAFKATGASIAQRALEVKNLAKDQLFVQHLRGIEGGLGFLGEIKYFLRTVVVSAKTARATREKFMDVYERNSLGISLLHKAKHQEAKSQMQKLKAANEDKKGPDPSLSPKA